MLVLTKPRVSSSACRARAYLNLPVTTYPSKKDGHFARLAFIRAFARCAHAALPARLLEKLHELESAEAQSRSFEDTMVRAQKECLIRNLLQLHSETTHESLERGLVGRFLKDGLLDNARECGWMSVAVRALLHLNRARRGMETGEIYYTQALGAFFKAERATRTSFGHAHTEWKCRLRAQREILEAYPFTFEGLPYRVLFGPNILKNFEEPGYVEFAVFPCEPSLISLLCSIHDPTFEHFDGALAIGRLRVTGHGLIIEETQSDIPDLLRRRGLHATIPSVPAIALSAVGRLAESEQGVFLATPYRIFHTWWKGSFRFRKAAIYCKAAKQAGGVLVHDEEGALTFPSGRLVTSDPQHYWYFSPERLSTIGKP